MAIRKAYLVIPLWRVCQRYKKPAPPWIAVYTSLLEHSAWRCLSDAARSLLLDVWLFAAQQTLDGRIWGDPDYLGEVLGCRGDVAAALSELLDCRDSAGKPFPWLRYEDDPPSWREVRCRAAKHQPATARQPAFLALEGEEEGGTIGGKTEGEAQTQAQTQTQSQSQTQAQSPTADPADSGSPQRALDGVADPPTAQTQTQREAQAAPTPDRQGEVLSPAPGTAHQAPTVIESPAPTCGLSVVPLFPPGSDGGSRKAPGVALQGESALAGLPHVRTLGQSLPDWLKALADPLKAEWVQAVFTALAFKFPADSVRGRQELGTYEAAYDRLMAEPGLTERAKMEVLAHDLNWARTKGHRGGNRKKGAVFIKVHKQRVATYLSRTGGRKV